MSTTLWIHSAGVAFGAWLVAAVAGVTMAVTWMTGGPGVRRFCWIAGAVTLALPPFLPASCWLELTAGWRTAVGPERASQFMLLATALVLGLGLWPLTMFFVLGAWQRIQPSLLEAEPELRHGALVQWVLWPAARTALGLSSVLTLTLALANFTVPTLFQVRVFTEEFWIRYNTQFDLRGALEATWPLWLLPVGLGWAFHGREVTWPRESSCLSPRLLVARLGAGPVWLARLMSATVLLGSLALPVFQLMRNPRTWTELPGAFAAASRATGNSFVASSITALVVVGLSLAAVARGGIRPRIQRGHVSRALVGGLWLLFLLPGVFLSVGLILALNRPGFAGMYASMGVVWLALGLRYFAPAWSGVGAARRAEDSSLAESARLLGARRAAYFGLVTWPQSGRAVIAIAYAVYLLSLWDVETLVLIQPPGGETLALRIFNLLHYGHAAQVNALCLVTLSLALLPLLAFWSARRMLVLGLWNRISAPAYGRGASLVLVVFLASSLGGCSDSNAADPRTTPLNSRIFSGVEIIGSRGVAPGQFNKPRSLTCDRADNLYVADITGRIQKFSPDGRFLLQWQMPQTTLGKAKGMSLDPAGNILVVEPHYQRVNHFTSDGILVAQWGRRGTNAGEFILPRCVAVNSAGEYFLGEYTTVERVQRFSLEADLTRVPMPRGEAHPSFRLQGNWGQPGQANGDFNRAEGITIGPGDAVYVADSCNHRIQVFDREGRFLRTHGKAGSSPGQFSFPYDIRVDARGRQFICEFGNSRLSVFDASDHLVETIGRAGHAPGEFANPWAICFDSQGNLYVADSQNHRVQKLLRRPATIANRTPPISVHGEVRLPL